MYQVIFLKIKPEHNKQQCLLKFTAISSNDILQCGDKLFSHKEYLPFSEVFTMK